MTTTVGMEVFLPMQGLEPAAGAEALGLRGLGHPQASQAVHGARLPLLGRQGGDRVAESGQKSDAGRDWGQEEKGTTEDEMAGWHH